MKKSYFVITILLAVSLTFSGVVGFSAQEPKQGGTLNVAISYGDPSTLDPHLSSSITSNQVIEQIFDGLIAIEPGTLEIKPEVAKNWIASADGKTYWFKLRKGVKFHNGTELTASDFKYSAERIGDPDFASPEIDLIVLMKGAREYMDGEAEEISGITVIDKYTLKIELTEFSPAFLYGLCTLDIVPKEVAEEKGEDFTNNPIGSGPFKFEKWRRGSEIQLSAFEDYYAGRPYLDKLNFKVMIEPGARQAAFDSKGVDFMIADGPMYEKYKKMPKSKVKLLTCAEFFTRNMIFNLDHEPLSNKKVRQAINYAIDSKAIIDNVLRGKAIPAVGWLPSSSPAFNEDLKGYPYDPEKAKQLMKEAGYEDGVTITVMARKGGGGAWGTRAVEAAMPYLKEIGVKVNMQVRESGTANTKAGQGDFKAYMYSQGGYVSPFRYLNTYFHSETERIAGNYWNYSNPEVDKLLDKAQQTTDYNERMEILGEVDAIITEDAPSWFYNYNKAVAVVQPWVHGLKANPRDNAYHDYDKVWIEK
ncbi:ABC transporter substrate-binding protein [Candidatus Bipolaricaulota bacterium]|nr:ABC transporter substrate-binding protein [Candidatus Bipolaricaulota bacterium]